ncbi:MAG: tetratricopeptide repeat protein [Lachnospiraceae bacterium]|nr:tetratricopeptide repeat protein [Lachnospiraceae bacterium]
MICPKCGANMTLKKGTCSKCGYDIEVNQKTRRISCYFYNQGLAKAKVRDLSGAADMLNRALKMSKKNVDARNLLGLVYFEMGETVQAIHEWIISKSFLQGNNPAERYLNILQSNPTKLDNLNGAIRKYNSALDLAQHDGADLALIQLKKAVSLNPKFIRAWQLLALLYMRAGEYEYARKCIKRTLAIDIANTTSIRYLKEIRELSRQGKQIQLVNSETDGQAPAELEDRSGKGRNGILPAFRYEEDKPDYRIFLSLMLGVFLGIMVVFFMVVPGVKSGMKNDFKSTQAEYAEELSGYLSDIDSLEKENQSLQSKIELQEIDLEALNDELEELGNRVGGVNMFRLISYYLQLQEKESASRMEIFILQKRMNAVSEEELKNEAAKGIYDRIQEAYPDVMTVTMTSSELFEQGLSLYDAKNYEEALEFFQYSYEKSADNERNLYYLGRTYQLLDQKEEALRTYNEYMERFPEGQYYDAVYNFAAEL